MKVFVIDVGRCNGCYTCQIVCKDEHVDNDWSPIAKPQPNTGHFWMKMHEKTAGSVPKVQVHYTPKPCMHCEAAPCLEAGGDAVYRRADGLIIIDPEKAVGRKELPDSCPYGAIYWNDKLNLPQKCTGCAHLVDEGLPPRCVDVLPARFDQVWRGRRTGRTYRTGRSDSTRKRDQAARILSEPAAEIRGR